MYISKINATEVELEDRKITINQSFEKVDFFRDMCQAVNSNFEDFPGFSARIQLIKIVREGLDIGLRDAKDFAEQA